MVSSNDTEIVDLANEEIIKCEEDIATIQVTAQFLAVKIQ